jgi:hypothetical protein
VQFVEWWRLLTPTTPEFFLLAAPPYVFLRCVIAEEKLMELLSNNKDVSSFKGIVFSCKLIYIEKEKWNPIRPKKWQFWTYPDRTLRCACA